MPILFWEYNNKELTLQRLLESPLLLFYANFLHGSVANNNNNWKNLQVSTESSNFAANIKAVSIMTAIEIQSSLAKTIYEINDISILEQVKNAIQRIMSIKSKPTTTTNKFELTPFVKKMCTGHGLDNKIDDKRMNIICMPPLRY